jgi:hypothetical protein
VVLNFDGGIKSAAKKINKLPLCFRHKTRTVFEAFRLASLLSNTCISVQSTPLAFRRQVKLQEIVTAL